MAFHSECIVFTASHFYLWLLLSGETVVHEMLFVTGVTRECFSTQYFIDEGALTVPLPYGKQKRLSQLLLAALLVEKYHLETEYSIPPAPITPTLVAVIKLKSMILERWWEINMQTLASVCSQEQRKRGGGGGNNIRSKETTDLNHVPLEFTFEFH